MLIVTDRPSGWQELRPSVRFPVGRSRRSPPWRHPRRSTMQIHFVDPARRSQGVTAVGAFTASQLLGDPACSGLISALTDGVSQFMAHRDRKELVERHTQVTYQLIGSGRRGQEQGPFEECLAFFYRSERRAALIEAQPLR